MDKATLEALYAPFELKERQGMGGMTFKYIPSDSIINRMNKVFEGNWSTEVENQEVIEDSVLVRVKVNVFDSQTEKFYGHTGFGSSSFKRYSSGPNQGKIIDVGNAYKSALSMAIRNAAAKFGCGLYLEGEDEAHGPENYAQENVPAPPKNNAPNIPTPPTPAPQQQNTPPAPEPQAQTPKPEPAPQTPPTPPVPSTPGQTSAPVENKPEPSLPPTPPAPAAEKAPTQTQQNSVPEPPPAPSGDEMSTVQEAALDALVTIKGLDYNTLVTEAFQDAGLSTDKIPERNELKGSEATIVIKYGNDKSRR